MTSFDFFSVPRIIFGRGQFARIGELAAQFTPSALLVYNGSQPLAEKAVAMLCDHNVRAELYRQHGEPKIADVDAALEVARQTSCKSVIGIGGGSAIDCAKAVAGMLTNRGAALDYMEVIGKGQKITQMAAPWIAVPTTAGTGAEVTRNAVIGSPDRKFKASIRGEQLLARIALVDPELGIHTPPNVTAASGMDALCQCIESYTSTGAQIMTDALALEGIRSAAGSILTAWRDPADVSAREKMALAALLSGITLTNAGLGAVHGFAAPLGANFPVPHGVVCAALLPHVIAANIAAARAMSNAHPVLQRYAVVGRLLLAGELNCKSAALPDAQAAGAAAQSCAQLASDLQIPPLRNYGISQDDVPAMTSLAKKASSMRFNPIPLSDAALEGVLRKAL